MEIPVEGTALTRVESTRGPVDEIVDWLIVPDETAIALVEKGDNVDSTMIGSLIEPDIVAVPVVAGLLELLDKTMSPLVESRLGPIDKRVERLPSADALGAVVKTVLMALADGTLRVLKAVSFPLVGVVADPIATLL